MAKKSVVLALQGGGSYGAFTWGVLDRLLKEKEFEVIGVSGASAGAINATCMVYGLILNGNDGARKTLNDFWRKLSKLEKFSPFQQTLLDKMLSMGNIDFNPIAMAADAFSTVMSPYQWNPLDINPMIDVLNEVVSDFDVIRQQNNIKLYLSATNVRTSDLKVFSHKEINADKVMASACLPRMFKAVEIDGEFYWDGGFTGNPAMFPLIVNTKCKDLLIIEIESVNHALPWTVKHIEEREAEISFNSSLVREMDAIAMYNKGVEENKIVGEKVRLHYLNTGGLLNDYNRTSRYNISWDWLSFLHDKGYKTASNWLEKYGSKIGEESSWIHPGLDQ